MPFLSGDSEIREKRLEHIIERNPSAATIDGTQQVINADGSVSCPVVSLVAGPGGVANITGVDASDQLAAGDVDTVVPPVGVAVKATAVLS